MGCKAVGTIGSISSALGFLGPAIKWMYSVMGVQEAFQRDVSLEDEELVEVGAFWTDPK